MMDDVKHMSAAGSPVLTSILLQPDAVREKVLARCFCGSGQERAHHDGRSAESERLDDVTYRPDTTISNHRHPKPSRILCDPENCRSLGPTNCHHLLCDTNRTTPHSHSQCIRACVYEILGLGSGYNISSNDLQKGTYVTGL